MICWEKAPNKTGDILKNKGCNSLHKTKLKIFTWDKNTLFSVAIIGIE